MDVSDASVPIDALVSAVKNAIREADISASDPGRDLRVTTIGLSLQAVATVKAGGGLDFPVPVLGWKLKVGATRSRQRTHTIEISLVSEPATQVEVRRGGVEESLVEAITTIRAAIAAAASGDDPFVLDQGTIELAFAVTDEGTISVG